MPLLTTPPPEAWSDLYNRLLRGETLPNRPGNLRRLEEELWVLHDVGWVTRSGSGRWRLRREKAAELRVRAAALHIEVSDA